MAYFTLEVALLLNVFPSGGVWVLVRNVELYNLVKT